MHIETDIEDIGDEDCGYYIATATGGGMSASASGYDSFAATGKAIDALKVKLNAKLVMEGGMPCH